MYWLQTLIAWRISLCNGDLRQVGSNSRGLVTGHHFPQVAPGQGLPVFACVTMVAVGLCVYWSSMAEPTWSFPCPIITFLRTGHDIWFDFCLLTCDNIPLQHPWIFFSHFPCVRVMNIPECFMYAFVRKMYLSHPLCVDFTSLILKIYLLLLVSPHRCLQTPVFLKCS